MKTLIFNLIFFLILLPHIQAQDFFIDGPKNLCIGQKYAYTLNTKPPAGYTYQWTLKPSSGTQIGTDEFYFTPTSTGTFVLQAIYNAVNIAHPDINFTRKSNELTVVVIKEPEKPSVIKGNFNPCGLITTTYGVDLIPSATSFEWSFDQNFYIKKTDINNNCEIQFKELITGSSTIWVQAKNQCGISELQNATITLNQRPSDQIIISGVNGVCENSVGHNFTVPNTPDITNYCWTCQHDDIFSVKPSVNNVNINVGMDTTIKTNPYNKSFTVKLDNQCGSTVITKTLAINKVPAKPKSIQGKIDITDVSINYIYTTISDYADKINWTISPSNAANQINDKSGNNDSLILNINKSYSGTITLTAIGNNSCGMSKNNNQLMINILPKPEKAKNPDGDLNVCVNKDNIYTTTCNYATTYEWELNPSNAGTLTVNLDKCQIDWDNNFNGAVSLRVRGVNTSGQGEWSNYSNIVVFSLPTKPLTPSGDLVLCINSPSSTYTSATTFATSYEWELNPTTAGVIFNNGQNAVINWDNTFVGKAYLRVRGVNSCGIGEWSTFTEITISSQAIPPVINGNFKPCAGETVIYNSASSDSIIWAIEPLNSYISYKVLSKSQMEVIWNRDNLASPYAAIKTYSKSNCGISTIKIDSVVISRFSPTGTAPVLLSTIKPFYCSNDSVEVIFSTNNQLLWFSNNQQFATGFKNTINFKTGIRQINVTSILANNCYSASKSINFNVDEVKAEFTANTLQANVGSQIDFKNLSVGGDTYEWDFGDNSFPSNKKDDYHTYYNKGIYTVKLNVLSKNKCSDLIIKSNYITILAVSVEEFEKEELSIFPNPFSSVINIQPKFIDNYIITITDITGKLIYINDNSVKEINTDQLQKGMYFLKIQSKEKIKTYKLNKI